MPSSVAKPVIAELRERIRHLEGAGRPGARVLPFGVEEIDRRLPGGGLMLGCLHEVAGGGNGSGNRVPDNAAAALFAAGIAARIVAHAGGRVLWCVTRRDLFAPALAQVGLAPDRVIHAETGDERDLLACFEEGLRHGGLGAVVAEVTRLPMAVSRRLQLAAERSGTTGIAVRRWRHPAEAGTLSLPTAVFTRWRVSVLPSVPLPVPGVGRARWRLELVRCRGGEGFDIDVEACDAEGRIAADRVAVSAAMVDGSFRQASGRNAL